VRINNLGGGGHGIIPAFAFRENAEYENVRNSHRIPTENFLNTVSNVALTPVCSLWDPNSVVLDCLRERAVGAEITLSITRVEAG
jgi:hypothetical protein